VSATPDSAPRRAALAVEGMSCASCLRTVRRALEGVPGAHVESVQMGLALVDYDPARTSPEDLAAAAAAVGYRATPIP